MKIAWFCASPSVYACSYLYGVDRIYGSGNWIDDEASRLVAQDPDLYLYQISTRGSVYKERSENQITYIDMGIGVQSQGKVLRTHEIDAIDNLIKSLKVDLIQIWGTETTFSYYVVNAANTCGVPVILCPQGLIASLCHFPNGWVTAKQMCGFNPINWIKMPLFNRTRRSYDRQLPFENKTIKSVKYILSDNDWTFEYCKSQNSGIEKLYYPLPVNDCYFGQSWSYSKCKPFSIVSVSPRGSYKGQHVLIKAVARLVGKYPQIKVYFPGMASKVNRSFIGRIKETPYVSYLKRLINAAGIERNIIFLDRLAPEELSELILRCNVFVNTSVIESNCMSLREAMCLGIPSISAYAGSIQEYMTNNENGLLYRYEEDEILSSLLERVFMRRSYSERLGGNARSQMKSFYCKDAASLIDIYKSVLTAERRIGKLD